MRKIKLKQIRNCEITSSIRFRASPSRFKKIAKALDNTNIRWVSGHKPTNYGQDPVESADFKVYYISKNALGELQLSRGSSIPIFNRNKEHERVSIL